MSCEKGFVVCSFGTFVDVNLLPHGTGYFGPLMGHMSCRIATCSHGEAIPMSSLLPSFSCTLN